MTYCGGKLPDIETVSQLPFCHSVQAKRDTESSNFINFWIYPKGHFAGPRRYNDFEAVFFLLRRSLRSLGTRNENRDVLQNLYCIIRDKRLIAEAINLLDLLVNFTIKEAGAFLILPSFVTNCLWYIECYPISSPDYTKLLSKNKIWIFESLLGIMPGRPTFNETRWKQTKWSSKR